MAHIIWSILYVVYHMVEIIPVILYGHMMWSTSKFGPKCGLRHQVRSKCEMITYVEVNANFQKLCRISSAEIHPCQTSLTRIIFESNL